jgi:hypothetical protein
MPQHSLEGEPVDQTHYDSMRAIRWIRGEFDDLKREIQEWTLPTIPSQKRNGHKY